VKAARPPGRQSVLPLSSPLRTGHAGCPSSGSSPWPLSPVHVVTLPRTPGVYETCMLHGLCSTLTGRDKRVRFSVFSRSTWDATQSAWVSLLLVHEPPLCLVGFPAHVLLRALHPVLAQSWVIGRVLPWDGGAAGERGCVGGAPRRLSFPACPRAVVPPRASRPPLPSCVRMSALRPAPEPRPWGLSHLLKDVLGRAVSGGMRPASPNGGAGLRDPHCRGVLLGVQGGSHGSEVLEPFCLLWDGQPCSSAPALPEREPQEVAPCLALHQPGVGCTARPSTVLEELFPLWSARGFQFLPWGGCAHTGVSVWEDRDAALPSCAVRGGSGASIRPGRVAPPVHPLPCHRCPPWGEPSSLGRAGVRGREGAACDHAGLQPPAHRGGAYGPCGQQRALVPGVTAAAEGRVEPPGTAVLVGQRRREGFDGLERAASWPNASGVGGNARGPGWLQGRLDAGLPPPVLAGRYAQGSVWPVVLGERDPSDRSGFGPLAAQALWNQLPAGCWRVVPHAIQPCGVWPLVVLGETADRQEGGGRGAHKECLEGVDLPPCRRRGGSGEPLLPLSSLPFHRPPRAVSPRCRGGCRRPVEAWFPRLTSPRMRTRSACSALRPPRKSAPGRAGEGHCCGPLRPVPGRRALCPSSPPLGAIPLPCGRETTDVGSRGLPPWSRQQRGERSGGSLSPGGRAGGRRSQNPAAVLPTSHCGCGLSASWATSRARGFLMTRPVRATLPSFPRLLPRRGWQKPAQGSQSFVPQRTRQHVWGGTPGQHGARSGALAPSAILLHRPYEVSPEDACSPPGHRVLNGGDEET